MSRHRCRYSEVAMKLAFPIPCSGYSGGGASASSTGRRGRSREFPPRPRAAIRFFAAFSLEFRREGRDNDTHERAELHHWNYHWRLTYRQAARTQAKITGTEPLLKANGKSGLMAEISLWNTATRRKEIFRPMDPGNVRMYLCGPTVYDRAHIGNARPSVVFDVLFSLLRHVYGADCVTFVRNFTDIDDKIIARAKQLKSDGREGSIADLAQGITDETIRWYHDDMDSLGVRRPTHEPRATDFVPQMISMIESLCSTNHAYEAEGHVLFSVDSYGDYGSLARRELADMRAGARVEVAPYKRKSLGLRALETVGARFAGLAEPVGPRTPRVAHRMLGYEQAAAGKRIRHSRGRHRLGLSSSRKRSRAEPVRRSGKQVRQILAPQRHAPG